MKISNETKVGVLAATALVLLIIGYNYLKGNDVFSTQNEFYGVFARVDGLEKSNVVLMNGLSVGRVSRIDFNENGHLVVELSVRSDILVDKASTIRLISADLLGTKAIDLMPGRSGEWALDGDTLRTSIEPGLAESVNKEVLPVKVKAENLMASLDTLLYSVQSIFTPEFVRNVQSSLNSVRISMDQLAKATDNMEVTINRIDSISAHLEDFTQVLSNNAPVIDSIIGQTNTITRELSQAQLQKTMEEARKALQEMQILLAAINSGEGTLGQLANNKELYQNLNQAAMDLDLLLKKIRENPRRNLRISVF